MHRIGSSRHSSPVPGTIGNVEPYYSNEDIAILHDVVILAEELLPKLPARERLPTNALFSAYYDVLPRLGVNSDHDSRYARVLFKIGGRRGNGSLYEKFEAVLSRMGIEIEFDQTEKENNSQLQVHTGTPDGDRHASKEEVPTQSRGRRNSDTSTWQHRHVSQPIQRRRPSSTSPIQESMAISKAQSSSPAVGSGSRRRLSKTYENATGTDVHPRHTVEAWMSTHLEAQKQKRARSVSSYGGVKVLRRGLGNVDGQQQPLEDMSYSLANNHQTGSDLTVVTSTSEHGRNIVPTDSLHGSPTSNGSDDFLQNKASLFRELGLVSSVKQRIRIWWEEATARKYKSHRLELTASDRDRHVLLHQALQSWSASLVNEGRVREMERFFIHLERRSGRARAIYLLHKAFTHWVKCTDVRVQGTLLARRHIVRTRVFNAWREHTAVNELKVRRHVTKHFFECWRKRCFKIATDHDLALQKYKAALKNRVYTCWSQHVKENNGAALWREGIQRQTISRWIIAVRIIRTGREVAAPLYQRHLARTALYGWRARTSQLISQAQDAYMFGRSCTCAVILRKWRRETRIIPARNALRADVITRLVRETFATWGRRTKQEQQASATDRSRIFRKALTSWRYRLRAKVLKGRINDRFVVESVYAWALKERFVVVDRLLNGKILRLYMQTWVQKCKELQRAQLDRELVIQSFTNRRRQTEAISHWHSNLERTQQLKAAVSTMRTSKLALGTLSAWSNDLQHIRQLQQWAADAEFWFLASKCLNRWKESLEAAKREKRRAAYVQVRRLRKNNLADAVLAVWRTEAQDVLKLDSQGLIIRRNKSIRLGMKIFDRWRSRALELCDLRIVGHNLVLRKHLASWKTRSAALQLVEFETRLNLDERSLSRLVKKWSLTALQLRNQEYNAAGLYEKKSRRACRKMFIYWRQKTSLARPVEHMNLSLHPHILSHFQQTVGADALLGFTGQIQVPAWDGTLQENAQAFVPGYLSTPSRTKRVMAAAGRFSSTTPKVALSTPFERLLRAQYPGRLLSASKRAGTRSAIGATGRFAGFADIVESEQDEHA